MSNLNDLNEEKRNVEAALEFSSKVERLLNNKDFQEIIEKNYFKEEPIRALRLSIQPAIDAATKEDCIRIAQAPGYLINYLRYHLNNIEKLKSDLENINNAIHEIQTMGE
jgi:hypothetical protein